MNKHKKPVISSKGKRKTPSSKNAKNLVKSKRPKINIPALGNAGISPLRRMDMPTPDGVLVHYGHSLLKELDGKKISGIDLLVREAIQNSADAAPRTNDPVRIEFFFSDFKVSNFDGILDEITLTRWKEIEKPPQGVALEVRDYGVGLSGPRSLSEIKTDSQGRPKGSYGNFYKLTKSIGQAQEKSGAGGAFGVGKTIYYRISGLPVMFYSRFKDGDLYRERLLFCMIEDEQNREKDLEQNKGVDEEATDYTLLQNSTGIAWWGCGDSNEILPIDENDDRLEHILTRMGVDRYCGNETGTSILIPYINPGQLPQPPSSEEIDGTAPPPWLAHPDDERMRLSERERLSSFTELAIERWYAPRLGDACDKELPQLAVFVDGLEVLPSKPLFLLIKELHRMALTGDGQHCDKRAKLIEVISRNAFQRSSKSIAGHLAIIRIPHDDKLMKMRDDGGDYCSPEIQAADYPSGFNKPIIALVRQPGMVVSYECNTDPWVNGICDDPNHKVIGVFVLNKKALLSPEFSPHGNLDYRLEDYVRLSEGHAHNEWIDDKANNTKERLNLFDKLIKTVTRHINQEYYGDAKKTNESRGAELISAVLGDMILPPGFGGAVEAGGGGGGKKGGGGGGGKKGVNPSIEVLTTDFMPNEEVKVEFELKTGFSNEFLITISASAESGSIGKNSWEDQIKDTPFPFEILRFETKSRKKTATKGIPAAFRHKLEKTGEVINKVSTVITFDSDSAISFSTMDPDQFKDQIFVCEIVVKVRDKGFLPLIEVDLKPAKKENIK